MQKTVYEFISQQTSDPIIERRTCTVSGQDFPIYQSDKEFYGKVSPTFGGKKYTIPFPTLCPEERMRRRMIFRNERKLYHSTCASTGKAIISLYAPHSGYTVYENNVRWSDQRNPLDYGQDFDFTKSFTEQYQQLLKRVPHPAVFNKNSENSLFCNHVGDMKNAYLVAASRDCEDIMYASKCFKANHCVDVFETFQSEYCYEILECEKSYKLMYSQQCDSCRESYLLFDCHNCEFCFGCWNLVGKKYHFFNQPYSKEVYEEKIRPLINSRSQMQKYKKIWQEKLDTESIRKHFFTLNTSNCYGDRISNAQNCHFCYNVSEIEDCKYVENGAEGLKDVYDAFGAGLHQSLNYEIMDTGVDATRNLFTAVVHNCSNMIYAWNCEGCNHCFGCVGLVNKQYCIFNKQHTKQTYEQEVGKIIAHMQEIEEWGEFFHPKLSPRGYNETVAQENFLLQKQEVFDRGYQWFDGIWDPVIPQGANIIQANDLPDTIAEVDDSITSKIIICEKTKRPFKILTYELEFYRKLGLPLPTKHPDVRYMERLEQKPSREMYLCHCDKCEMQIVSIYADISPFKVYCEKCYDKEIYG